MVCFGVPVSYFGMHLDKLTLPAVIVSALAIGYSSFIAIGVRFYTSRYVVALRERGDELDIGTLNWLGTAVTFLTTQQSDLQLPPLRSRRFPHWVGLRVPIDALRIRHSITMAAARAGGLESKCSVAVRREAEQLRADVEDSCADAVDTRVPEPRTVRASRRVFIVDTQGDILQPARLRALLALPSPPAP
jgi:hypothetical protein